MLGVDITVISSGKRPKLTEQAVHSLLVSEPGGARFVLLDDTEQHGVGWTRNTAIEKLRENRREFLYCSDDDVYFTKGWLDTLLANFAIAEKLGFKLLGGYCHPYNLPVRSWAGTEGYRIDEKYAVGSASWLMRWEAWDEFGPLDAHAKGINQSEDVAFCNKIRAAGFRVGNIYPYVVVNCGVTGTFGQPCPGADLVKAEAEKAGVYYE